MEALCRFRKAPLVLKPCCENFTRQSGFSLSEKMRPAIGTVASIASDGRKWQAVR
jgi:hypothetical protein